HVFDVGLNVRDETAFRILLGPQHRIFDGPGVGTAMGLDHRLLDPQEGCAAHLAGIQQLFHLPQIPFHQTGGQLGLGAGEEHLLQGLEQELAYALHGFQHHIAGEAVGNDHIGGAHHGLVGLHIADEVDAAGLPSLFQQGVGLMAQGVALLLLRTDVQKAHPGLFDAHDPLGVVAAQVRKLEQVLRRALGVGAAVAEDR
ncbi:signal peptidase I, partial [Dysosmobacter welbionis]